MNNQLETDIRLGQIQASILALHEQRRQIVDSQDPLERQRLLHAHREEMYQHMLITRASGALGQSTIGPKYEQKEDNDYE